ncbi:FH1/FH2 domain-containing protein 1-like [Sander lucioperca]|uniref:FHOD1 N-terminal GTPase-binding domain-containing protein n=1 Tax=Sander lucioperca TaxID=283035 RepID=A0A8D0A8Z2_SANLU|nr:FH1/FH2 domain-containing protein 1-like [Sander lucioperca]
MASFVCRIQYLEDSDPFICTNFPEPRRPPTVSVEENLPLSEQIAGIHKLLEAPLKLEDCTLQLASNGNYLDLDSSLSEQRDELDTFYEDVAKGKKPILILRTQLSVRVHSILGNYLSLTQGKLSTLPPQRRGFPLSAFHPHTQILKPPRLCMEYGLYR